MFCDEYTTLHTDLGHLQTLCKYVSDSSNVELILAYKVIRACCGHATWCRTDTLVVLWLLHAWRRFLSEATDESPHCTSATCTRKYSYSSKDLYDLVISNPYGSSWEHRISRDIMYKTFVCRKRPVSICQLCSFWLTIGVWSASYADHIRLQSIRQRGIIDPAFY
jgi:hypothetical protein